MAAETEGGVNTQKKQKQTDVEKTKDKEEHRVMEWKKRQKMNSIGSEK